MAQGFNSSLRYELDDLCKHCLFNGIKKCVCINLSFGIDEGLSNSCLHCVNEGLSCPSRDVFAKGKQRFSFDTSAMGYTDT